MSDTEDKWSLLEGISWKSLTGSVDDDWVDRMSHKWTVTILLFFAVVVSSVQYVGDPIYCWCPAEFKKWHVAYAKNYCWVSNTYYVPMSDVIPGNTDARMETELGYYQWVPIILLTQALLFKLPYVLWHMTNRTSGLNLTKLCRLIDTIQMDSAKTRDVHIRNITLYLNRWLRNQRKYNSSLIVKVKQRISKTFLFCFGQTEGLYLSGIYFIIKSTYLANCIIQFWILSEFLSLRFLQYGVDNLNCIFGDCSEIERPVRFPRATLCDFQIRQQQNIQPYTVQCVLPINLFNEKIFIFIWFWTLIIGVFTFINTVTWLKFILVRNSRQSFVRKFLNLDTTSTGEKQISKQFADQYLRNDGCFVLKIIRNNTSDVTLTELMKDLWDFYREPMEPEGNNNT